VIYGLAAALGWGFSDFTAAVVSRRIGSFTTVVVSQVTSVVLLLGLVAVVGPSFDGLGPGSLGLLVLNGFLLAIAYVIFYRALAIGPVGLVSPIVAAYGGVAVPLAILLLDERLSTLRLVGTAVTVCGVVLTSTDVRKLSGGRQWSGTGIAFGLGSMVLFAVATIVMGYTVRETGWMQTVVVSRSVTAALLVGAAYLRRTGVRSAGVTGLAGAAFIGLADITGVGFYARGAEVGLVSIVAAVSATFILIPVIGGVVLLGERPAPNQSLGVAMVLAGLVLIGLGG